MKVNSIISSFMGEQNRYGIGAPCTILRLQGCKERCFGCDTPDALTKHLGEEMTVEQIHAKLEELGNQIVLVTGGEPLEQDLTDLLIDYHSFVIETNGMHSIAKYNATSYFVVDYKFISSGVKTDMDIFRENIEELGYGDYLKFVIRFWEDYHEMKDILKSIKYSSRPFNIAAGVHDQSKITMKELADKIREDKLSIWLNPQAHKIWFND